MSASGVSEELKLLLRSGWRLIALESFEEERATAVLERVAKSLERPCISWSLARGLGETGQGAGAFDLGLQAIAAHEAPALFTILDAHRVLDDPIALRRLRDLLPQLGPRRQAIALVGPNIDTPVELVREMARVELPLPGPPELHKLFQRVVDHTSTPVIDERLIDDAVRGALGLAANEAARVLRKALRVNEDLNEETVRSIIREKRRMLRRTPALSFHEDEAGLGDVGGLGELKRWLRERQRALGPEAVEFGLPTPRGLLLLGVQGCGKSLCAKAVAREWQLPLLRLDLAATFASTTDSPERVIREATAVAESLAPAVLWIDEIEKGFAASGKDAAASRVFGSFLTWLSEKSSPVFVVATANDVGELPPELLRRGRFDELFFVDLPTEEERAEILGIHLRKRGRDPLQYRIPDLASSAQRLTGAELEQAVISALYNAFAEERELNDNDLQNAVNETVPIYDTYEERIKELRDWSRGRARPASLDGRMVDLFAPS